MRIIVTKNGKYVIQEIEEEKNIGMNIEKDHKKKSRNISGLKLPILNKNFSSIKLLFENTKKLKWGVNHRTKSVLSKKSLDNYFNRDESHINQNELEQAKKIKLSKGKINISQQFLNKYDDLDVTFKDKIKNLTNTLKSKDDKNNEEKIQNEIFEHNKIMNTHKSAFNKNDLLNNRKNIILGDIISRNNLLSLKTQLSRDNIGYDDARLPLDDNNIKSFNFRSKYEDKKATIEILSILLSLPMNPYRTNLIKYYKQNKDISPFYFENLIKYNESQIYKLNKICQMLFLKKEDEIKESKIIQEKKFNKEKLLKQKGNNYINHVNKIIKKTNKIINGYSLKQENNAKKRKKIFKEEVIKMKNKYWDKYKVDKYYRVGQVKLQNFISTTDFEELQNKEKKKNLKASKSSPNFFPEK